MRGTADRRWPQAPGLARRRRWKTILATLFDTAWPILLFVGCFGCPSDGNGFLIRFNPFGESGNHINYFSGPVRFGHVNFKASRERVLSVLLARVCVKGHSGYL